MNEQASKPNFITRFKSFVVQSKRVWHILRKPSGEEFKSIAKVSAYGILILGALGFVISDVMKIIAKISA